MAESRHSSDASDQVDGRQIINCQPCRKKSREKIAAWLCKTCGEYQCGHCIRVHEDFGFMSGHDFVQVVEEDTSIESVFDMKGIDTCKDHGKQFEFYCKDHTMLCCSSCAIGQHRGCTEVNEISSDGYKLSENIESVIEELQERTSSVKEDLNKTRLSTQCKLDTMLNSLERTKKQFVQKFDQLKATATEKFKSEECRIMQLTETTLSTTENIFLELQHQQEFLKSAKSRGTDEQIFIASHVIKTKIEPYKKKLKTLQARLYEVKCSVEYNGRMLELLEPNAHLATVRINTSPIGLVENTVLNNNEMIHSSLHSQKAIQFRLVYSLDLKPETDENEEPLYSGMEFFTDGRLVVLDNWNWKLYLLDENLQKRGKYKFDGYPNALCVVSRDEVAVTVGYDHLIEFFFISKINAVTLTRQIQTTSQYYSMCLMNETSFLVSTFEDMRPLRMVTKTGEELDFNSLSDRQYEFEASASTYIRNKDIAVLSDRYDHAVNLYCVSEKVPTILVVKHDDMKEPRGVCVGPDDCLFVCSESTNSIMQLSSSGKVVGSYKLDMKYPCTVCVSKDRKRLAVSNCAEGNGKLQLFDLLY